METPRTKIAKALAKYYPNVKDSTLNSYVSVVKKLFEYAYSQTETKPDMNNLDFYIINDPKLVASYVAKYETDNGKPMPPTTHRNIYSILMKIFPDTKEFHTGFITYNNQVREKDPNMKTEREEENWMSFADVKALFEREYAKHRPMLESNVSRGLRPPTTPQQDQKEGVLGGTLVPLSNFILLAVSSGVFIAPRRTMDWTEMKIRNYTPEDNFYEKGKFVFNKFKTVATYGRQEVKLPKALDKIIKQYIKKNPHDYLLVNSSGGKLNESGVPPRLNAIFDKKISTTMLRHIYLSEFHKDTPALKDMAQNAHDMGHSVYQQLEYVKR